MGDCQVSTFSPQAAPCGAVKPQFCQRVKFLSQLVLPFLLPPEGTSVLAGSNSLPPDFEMGLVSARSVPELPDAKLGGWESQEEGESCFGGCGGFGVCWSGEGRKREEEGPAGLGHQQTMRE